MARRSAATRHRRRALVGRDARLPPAARVAPTAVLRGDAGLAVDHRRQRRRGARAADRARRGPGARALRGGHAAPSWRAGLLAAAAAAVSPILAGVGAMARPYSLL